MPEKRLKNPKKYPETMVVVVRFVFGRAKQCFGLKFKKLIPSIVYTKGMFGNYKLAYFFELTEGKKLVP